MQAIELIGEHVIATVAKMIGLLEVHRMPVRALLGVFSVVALSSCGADSQGPDDGAEVDAWHMAMLDVPTPGAGCHEVLHPSMEWREVECADARITASAPSGARGDGARLARVAQVGGGNDWVVSLSGGTLSTVTGSFDDVAGVTSVIDDGIANSFSLQLNSNFFESSRCSSGGPSCRAWQQIVYSSDQGAAEMNQAEIGKGGLLYFQYWLLYDDAPCPSGTKTVAQGGCVVNSADQVPVPAQSAASLGEMHLTGSAGDTDQAILRIGKTLYSVTAPGSNVGLASGWTEAEFNIFGNGSAGQASFNSGASVDVKLTVQGFSGGTLACKRGGTTKETNNLDLDGECRQLPDQTNPTFVFTQTNT